jgi:hypothetical protein
MSALLVLLVLAVGVLGCGGGDGDSAASTDSGTQDTTPAGVAQARAPAQGKSDVRNGGKDASGKHEGGATNVKGGADSGKSHGGSGGKPGAGGSGPTPQQTAALEEKAAAHCPGGIDLKQCKALVKAAKQAEDTPSYDVSEPEDCLKAMSKSECEAIYAAQKQAADATGASVDVRACIQNPTPECEAIVRPILERQREAEEAAK